MPNLKEAAVAVSGQILDIEKLIDFDSKKPDGSVRVVVATGDGFASVKVRKDDAPSLGELAHFQPVNWMVRYGAWSRNDNAQTTCQFVREINEGDLDRLVSAAKNTK